MTNLMTASNLWATMPPDACYWGLSDMLEAARRVRASSHEADYAASAIAIESLGTEVAVKTPKGAALPLTYHAFGQVASLSHAPASYLRTLSPQTAALALAESWRERGNAEVSILGYQREGRWTARALNGEHYARLYTASLLEMIQERARGMVTPPAWVGAGWTGPTRKATAADVGDFTRVKEGDTIRPAGAYYSPETGRDTFLLLVHPERQIGLPSGGTGFRFVMLHNSEVGAASVGLTAGIVDIVCGNHILWNARELRSIRLRHVGEVSTRTEREISGAFGALDAAPWETEVLQGSARKLMGDDVEEAVGRVATLT